MLLSIIIVSYNTANLTSQTLKTVIENINQSSLLTQQTEIIVIDNNSQDDSVSKIKKILTQDPLNKDFSIPYILLTNSDNLGFAEANNQGLTLAKGDFLLLLNSDTICSEGSLENLVKTFLAYPQNLGILAANLVNKDGSPQPQGGDFPSLLSLTSQYLFLDDTPWIGKFFPSTQHTGKNQKTKTKNKGIVKDIIWQNWVGGTAMLISRKVYSVIGGLDEKIFMYGEDIDYCYRAHLHQFASAIAQKSSIIHLGSASSSSTKAIEGEIKAYLYLSQKYFPRWQLGLVKVILLAGVFLRICLFGIILKHQKQKECYQHVLQWLIIA